MKAGIKGILFDMDGTLLDTRELIYRSFEHVLKVFELSNMGRNELVSCWGEPLQTTMRRWSPQNYEELLRVYREYMYENHDKLVRAFDGVEALLKQLNERKVPVAVVTSKVRRGTERGLKHTGLGKYFKVVVTVEDTPKAKPHADPALLAAEKLGLDAGELMFVGDTVHDIYCAKHAGCTSVAVNWSECPREELVEACPDYFVANPGEILGLFNRLSKGRSI